MHPVQVRRREGRNLALVGAEVGGPGHPGRGPLVPVRKGSLHHTDCFGVLGRVETEVRCISAHASGLCWPGCVPPLSHEAQQGPPGFEEAAACTCHLGALHTAGYLMSGAEVVVEQSPVEAGAQHRASRQAGQVLCPKQTSLESQTQEEVQLASLAQALLWAVEILDP